LPEAAAVIHDHVIAVMIAIMMMTIIIVGILVATIARRRHGVGMGMMIVMLPGRPMPEPTGRSWPK
jgi:hypothetical protein